MSEPDDVGKIAGILPFKPTVKWHAMSRFRLVAGERWDKATDPGPDDFIWAAPAAHGLFTVGYHRIVRAYETHTTEDVRGIQLTRSGVERLIQGLQKLLDASANNEPEAETKP